MQTLFTLPTLVRFGRGASRELAPLLRENNVNRVFLVTDGNVRKAGLVAEPLAAMENAGIRVNVFDKVLPNAPDTVVLAAADQAREFGPDAVVSIGGGSCIDTAKGVNILLANPGPLSRYAGINRVPRPGIFHLAIPTTAGTSSEITVVAVISDTEHDKKMVLFGKNISASVALIDPALTDTLPATLTAHTGMDALTHALEAYISTAASPITDAVAPEAIALIAANLPRAYADGTDKTARDGVMLGCQLAGVCFSNAGLGLVHSLAQPMGGHCHVPHGLANAICLATVMRFTLPSVESRKLARMALALGLAPMNKQRADIEREIVAVLAALTDRLAIPGIAGAGVSRDKIPAMSRDALVELSTPTSPRQASLEEVGTLYEELFAAAEKDRSTEPEQADERAA